ncbi:hypothetical protein FKP32DRAFT_1134800 [Trametes sanguinea]|nr:hypothetical protein FKP32DRAFT_1134800 [Trametes sanguinea]
MLHRHVCTCAVANASFNNSDVPCMLLAHLAEHDYEMFVSDFGGYAQSAFLGKDMIVAGHQVRWASMLAPSILAIALWHSKAERVPSPHPQSHAVQTLIWTCIALASFFFLWCYVYSGPEHRV